MDRMDSSTFLQLLSCSIICVAGFAQGVLLMWTNPVLPQLINGTDHDPHLPPLTDVEMSFVSSAHNIGSMLGAALSGPLLLLAHYLGLHRLFPVLSLGSSLSWALLASVPDFHAVILGRLMAGLLVTAMASLSPPYIAAVSPIKYRGAALSIFNVVRNFGMIVTSLVGAYMPWSLMSHVFGTAPPLLIVLSFMFLLPAKPQDKPLSRSVPVSERPSYGSIEKTNGVDDVRTPLIHVNPSGESLSTGEPSNKSVFQSCFRLVFLGSAYSLSGIVPLTSFASDLIPCHVRNHSHNHNHSYFHITPIISMSSSDPLTTITGCTSGYPYTFTVATATFLLCNLLGSFISAIFTERFGRKPILIITNIILMLGTASLAGYYYILPCSPSSTVYCFIPIIVMIIFFIAMGVGIGTLFTVYLGDLPTQAQSFTLPTIMVWLNLLNYLQNQLFLLVVDWTGGLHVALPVIFIFHTVANLGATIFSCVSRMKIQPLEREDLARELREQAHRARRMSKRISCSIP